MALATQCPHCRTIFKVAHDQLKLRAGLVRCGACKQIFNGIEHLVPPDRLHAPAPQSARPAPSTPPAAPSAPPVAAADKPPTALRPPASQAAALPHKGKEQLPAARPAVQKDAPAAAPDHSLELAQVDDPETRTWIWSPTSKRDKAAEEPLEDLGEDPLTRMTLVDFSAFEEEEDAPPAKDEAAAEAEPPPGPAALAQPSPPDNDAFLPEDIWPDTTDPIDEPVEQKSALPEQSAGKPEARIPATPVAPQPEPAPDLPAGNEPLGEVDTDTDIDANTNIDSNIDTEISLADDPDLLAEESDSDAEEPGFVVRERRRQRLRSFMRIFMAVASVVLLVTALAQGAYAFRDQIAAKFPQYKAALADYCRLIGCQVKLPAQIDMVSIESSELQAQAADKNVFTLTLLLHNRSEVDQAWPYVELTLNDSNEKPLVRRILAPREYLATPRDAAKGFAAQSEQPVSVSFELLQLQASGYRVYLFYP